MVVTVGTTGHTIQTSPESETQTLFNMKPLSCLRLHMGPKVVVTCYSHCNQVVVCLFWWIQVCCSVPGHMASMLLIWAMCCSGTRSHKSGIALSYSNSWSVAIGQAQYSFLISHVSCPCSLIVEHMCLQTHSCTTDWELPPLIPVNMIESH